ncbi:HAD-IA family hydrolase [Lactobacillus helveticus]|uniref:HAD-IA family hydrolase n=1 Tax=Lactobacillus helveticus TaxID=1587 RepID=UPI001561F4F4|nr:HAD-IA family hydrolase [Lactobacillus helveticus]NRO89096.1 hypothetical protein [Lactobacillus helveticus]
MKLSSQQVINNIKQYKYVSFDVFDTLLKRNVERPTDLFTILEMTGLSKYGSIFKNFKSIRIKAEQVARNKVNEEVTLDDIYKELKGKFPNNIRYWAQEKEKKLEYKYCNINENIKPVYDYCINNNKKIVIITDIYLPQSLIEEMLKKCGITQWDALFVSSTIGLTKSTGNLFKYALDKLNIISSYLVHIGDNNISDVKKAKENGIRSIHIPTQIVNITYKKRSVNNIWDNVMQTFLNNNILSVNENHKLGYENMGPLLYGLCTWLIKELKREKIKKVYFMSRDGQIMKKAFDILNTDRNIQSYYFYASRRVLQVPALALNSGSYVNFINSLHWEENFTFKYFLKSLGLENSIIQKEISEKYQIDLNKKFSSQNLSTNSILNNVFKGEKNTIYQNAKDELNCLMGYIHQIKMDRKIAIVDIGWLGNMQRNLERILKAENENIDMHGYYVGIIPNKSHATEIKMKGYLFGPKFNLDLFKAENHVNALFEQIFMADHGSVKRLVKAKATNNYIPITYPYEQKSNFAINLLTNYQNGALQFLREVSSKLGKLNISSHYAFSGIYQQFINPTHKDAHDWGNIVFKDVNEQYFVKDNYYFSFLRFPNKFLKSYKSSMWKEGFLSVHTKHNLNYYWIVTHLHKPKLWRKKKNER